MQPWLVGSIGNDGDQLRLLGKIARVGVVVVVGGGGSGGHPVAVGVVGPSPAEPETVVEAGGSESGVEASAEKTKYFHYSKSSTNVFCSCGSVVTGY